MSWQFNISKCSIFVFLIFFFLTANCEDHSFNSPKTEILNSAFRLIDEYIQHERKIQSIPGLSLAITNRDSIIYLKHYGFSDLKLKTPITDTTLFQIGSISKSFTAIALLQLVDEGKLNLNKPVEYYLPWFSINTIYGPITTHHLLTHSSGIPANRDDITTSPYMAFALHDQNTGWPPGNRFYYSNIGYQVLHVLLEQLRKEDYKNIIKKNIFEPLQMANSKAYISNESRVNQAIGYIYPFDDRPSHSSRALVEAPYFEYFIGDGCIQSTAADMAAYLRMLMSKGKGHKDNIISEEAYKILTTKHIILPRKWDEIYYGYGLAMMKINGHDILEHRGEMIGFRSQVLIDVKSDIGFVLLSNSLAKLSSLSEHCISSVLSALENKEIPEHPQSKDVAYVENADDYTGRYSNKCGEKLIFRAADNHLYLILNSGEDIFLELYGEDKFYTPHPKYDLYCFQFIRDDSNSVCEVYHGPESYKIPSHKEINDFKILETWKSYAGKYRSYSPWFPYFEVFIRKGKLIALTGITTGGHEFILLEKESGVFKVKDFPQEIIKFNDIVDNKSLRVVWSGHQFYRSN